MFNKTTKTAHIVGDKGMNRRTNALTRGAGQCCPFLNKVRYYKTESLKDEKVFYTLNGGHLDKKKKVNGEIETNSGASMMSYLL